MLNPTNRNNAHIAFTFLDEIIHHPAVLDAVEDIIGPDILCWGTVLFIKEPESEAYVSWHQDLTYTPIKPHDGVSIWLALSPSNRETGCMRMLPGTHRDGIRTHQDTFGEHNVLTRGQNIDAIDPDNAVDLVLEPGQMSLHHGRTIHGSAPNLGNERRIGVVVQQFIPPHVRETHGEGYALNRPRHRQPRSFPPVAAPDRGHEPRKRGGTRQDQRALGQLPVRGRRADPRVLSATSSLEHHRAAACDYGLADHETDCVARREIAPPRRYPRAPPHGRPGSA